MLSLLLSTFAMMGLTFIIGFFVAGVIKVIAVWADSLDFFNTHQEEIARLKRLRKLHQKVARLVENSIESSVSQSDKREAYSRGVNDDPAETKAPGYYHGVSRGASKLDLLDYYYPEDTDTHYMYMKNREQMMDKQSHGNKKSKSTDHK